MALFFRLILLIFLIVPVVSDAAFFHGRGGGSAAPPTTPVLNSVAFSPASGFFNAGKVITITFGFDRQVNIAGGSFPTTTAVINLNSGATTAKCPTSLTGVTTWTCTYTVGGSDNSSALAMTASAFTLNSSTVVGTAGGTNANLTLANNFAAPGGIVIDTTAPTALSVAASGPGISGGNGTIINSGVQIAMLVTFSTSVTTSAGAPSLSLNNGGVATCDTTGAFSCVAGTFKTAYNFTYTTNNTQNTTALKITAFNLLSGNTVTDQANNLFVPPGATVPGIAGTIAINVGTPVVCTSNFFVTKNAPAGGNGTSVGTAWNSIAQVNAFRTFPANSCVNMNSSAGAFTDASLTMGPNVAAGLTNANPVVVQPASGQSGWTLQSAEAGTGAGVHVPGPGGWTITGMTLRPNAGGTNYGVHVTGIAGGATVTKSSISGFKGNPPGGSAYGELIVDNGAGGTAAQPFVLSNSTLGGTSSSVDASGVKIGGQYVTTSGNIVSWVSGGIGMCCAAGGPGKYITNNLIHDIVGDPNQCGGFGAIELDAPVANQVISRNEMYNVMIGLQGGCDGTGIDMDGSTGTTVAEFNFGHHNAGPSYYLCIGCYSEGGNPWGPNVVRYNISENDGFRQIQNSQSSGGIGINIKPVSQGGVGCSTGCTFYVYGNTVLQNTPGGNSTNSGFPALNLSTDGGEGPVPRTGSVIANNIFAYTSGNFAVACNFSFAPSGTWRNNNFWNVTTGTGAVALPTAPYGCGASSTTLTPAQWDTLVNNAGGSSSGSMGINPNFLGPVPFQPPSGAVNSSVAGSASLPTTGPLVNPSGYQLTAASQLLTRGINPYSLGVPLCSNTTTLNGIVSAPCLDFYGNATGTTASGGVWAVGAYNGGGSSGTGPVATSICATGGSVSPLTGSCPAGGFGSMITLDTYSIRVVFNLPVTVTNGSGLTLTTNQGTSATYSSGSGSNTLVFSFTPGATPTSQLSVTAMALSGGATVLNNGNAATVAPQPVNGLVAVNGVFAQFPSSTTNPIGSPWLSACAAAGCGPTGWADVQAFGLQATGVVPLNNTNGGDATASYNSGTWGASQEAAAVINFLTSPPPTGSGCCADVELRLNQTMTTGSITGYKASCALVPDSPHAIIRRQDGAASSFVDLAENDAVSCANGDSLRFTNNAGVLTFYKNGVVIAGPVTDTGYTTGNPGIAFYDIITPFQLVTDDGYGFNAFTAATAGGSPPPPTYTGPLDAIGGTRNVAACYSMRACSNAAAAAHKNAYRLLRTSDSATLDITLNTDGTANNSGALTFCGTGFDACEITIWYDQQSTHNLTLDAAPSSPPYTNPVWMPNTIGPSSNLPSILMSGINALGGDRALFNNSFPTSGQPYSISLMSQFDGPPASSGVPQNDQFIWGTTLVTDGVKSGGGWNMNTGYMIADTDTYFVTGATFNGSFHSFNDVLNGASSSINVDGVDHPGSITGNTGLTSTFQIGATKDGYLHYGNDAEVIVFNGTAFTLTQKTNLCHSQRLWAGTAGSC